jgi:hypothetical protein
MQPAAATRESDPAPLAKSTESADSTESFRAALRNEMSADAAAATQSKAQSAPEMAAEGTGKQKTPSAGADAGSRAEGTQTDASQGEAEVGLAGQTAIALNVPLDKVAIAKAAAQNAIQTGAATMLAKSDADVAARADAAAVVRGAANSAAAGEKAIATTKLKHGAQAVEESDPLTTKADAAPVPAAAVPAVAVAAPILAIQPKPADAGSDAGGGSVSVAGTKRARRAMANQIEAGAAKAANAKTAEADGQLVDTGKAASASKDEKVAAAAETGQAIAAAAAAQAGMQMHGSGLQPAADALTGFAVQGAAAVGSVAGERSHNAVSAANGGVVSGGAEANLPGHQILSAGPTQLEVGVMDGTHGWLQIRAELGSGGAISTSLTGSAAAHAPLQQAVPEMTSYLASESVSVSGIAVHRASETAGTMAWGQGQSEGQAGGSGTSGGGSSPTHDGKAVMNGAPGERQSRGDSSQQQQAAATPIGLGWMGGVSPAVFASGFSNGTSLAAGTGSWLSVRV